MPRYDYVSMGFTTYDCLGWPFTEVPAGGGTVFIDELTLAVSGAAGTAAIAAAKMGLKTLSVTGVLYQSPPSARPCRRGSPARETKLTQSLVRKEKTRKNKKLVECLK